MKKMTREAVHELVSQDIQNYIDSMRLASSTYDSGVRQASNQFLAMLETSDHLQAQLVVAGYLLCGGSINPMIVRAARAIQMTHATATHSTQSAAITIGVHAGEIILANLDVAADLRLKAVSITNRSLMLRAQASIAKEVHSRGILDARATEAVLNPLHVGMVLADADCEATDAITPYALAMGRHVVTGDVVDQLTAQEALASLTFWPDAELQLIVELFTPIKAT